MRAFAIALLIPGLALAQGSPSDYERANSVHKRFAGKVYRDKVDPHWLDQGNRFWYRVALPAGGHEHLLVDAEKGTRSEIAETELKEFREVAPAPQSVRPQRRGSSGRSPDGQWLAFLKDHNVWLRNTQTQNETQLSQDGNAENGYRGPVFWSPDSKKLVAMRVKQGGDRKVTLVETSPRDQLQPRVRTLHYLKPGDPIPLKQPGLFDVEQFKKIPVPNDLFANPWDLSYEHWTPDSKQFFFVYNQRGHQVIRVIALDANTGKSQAIVNEECKTFFDYAHKLYLHYLDSRRELIWMSERDGWNHLYRISMIDGSVKNCLTPGDWLVRGVDQVDEERQQVWFRCLGVDPKEDPYHVHYARVNFDGSGFTRLTEGDGTHSIRFSPNRKYYLDSYSRVDLAPVTELRRSEDGKKILTLETSDLSELRGSGWQPPERFVARGRDGKTDIWGVIVRPTSYDPKKRYRVIESIYAGPHGHHVPKNFRPTLYEQPMAELGFVLVKIDGMGTNWRSKSFHDVCWKNLGDSGFPDRIAWIKAAAEKYPNLDISKGVGIFGGSAGGQSTLRAMTEYPDFYTVGVSDCGCHDNRMDKIWWNELWMSWPVGPHYEQQSNVTNAHKLRGKLLLVVGEVDTNVDPASTMQVVNALIKADKDFDLLVVPGGGHGIAESRYGSRRRMDFFVRHLLGKEPRTVTNSP